MPATEALKSIDLRIVKVASSSVKKKVSSAVARINVLATDAKDDFDHEKISRTNVIASHSKLETNLKLFKDLHEVYCDLRDKGENEASEEAILEKDEKYPSETELPASMKSHLWLRRKLRLTKKRRRRRTELSLRPMRSEPKDGNQIFSTKNWHSHS